MAHLINENAISTDLTTEYGSTNQTTASAAVRKNPNLMEEAEAEQEPNYSVRGYQRLDETTSVASTTATSTELQQQQQQQQQQNSPTMDIQQGGVDNRALLLERIELGLNILAQLFIAFTAIYMSWFCLSKGLAGTALHAWLVTLGFACIMAEGVMVHYNSNVLTGSYNRKQKTRIHWILQAVGGFLGMLGALIKCIQKGFLLHTVHGKLGFIAFILCFLSMMSGLSALYAARTRVRMLWSPLQNKAFHNFLGLTTFIIAMLAQYYGYRTGFFSRHVSNELRLTMETITLIGTVLCCIGPMKAIVSKVKSLIRQFN